jgi:hypothetical protein
VKTPSASLDEPAPVVPDTDSAMGAPMSTPAQVMDRTTSGMRLRSAAWRAAARLTE